MLLIGITDTKIHSINVNSLGYTWSMGLEIDIYQAKLWNQFFLFSWKSDIDENGSLN